MWHQSFFLAAFSHFNPSSCETVQRGEKERWECQRGSTRQLRVINHRHDDEDERHERRSAADMAGTSLQRRDKSTDSANLRFVVDTTPRRHILREGREAWSERGGEANASRADRQTHTGCVLSYRRSSGSQRPPEYLMKTTELCIMKMFSGKVSSSNLTCTSGRRRISFTK